MFKKTHMLVGKKTGTTEYYLDINNPGYYLHVSREAWKRGSSDDYINRKYAQWDVVKCKPKQMVNK